MPGEVFLFHTDESDRDGKNVGGRAEVREVAEQASEQNKVVVTFRH